MHAEPPQDARAPEPVARALDALRAAIAAGTFVKATLSGPRDGAADAPRNVFARPVTLRAGPRLSFTYRYATRDVTANLAAGEGLDRIAALLAESFDRLHVFTTAATLELSAPPGGPARLRTAPPAHAAAPAGQHDRARRRALAPADCPWMRGLELADAAGRIRPAMAAKFRQVNRFVEILAPLLPAPAAAGEPLRLVDMGSGKGYLTFAAWECLRRAAGGGAAEVAGIERRAELAELCARVAAESGCAGLRFAAGEIADIPPGPIDILVALHACDTATDDARAAGVAAGARLILAAPCCHKELRPQLRPPPVLAGALRHGILRERQAEFVTDALRAALLEWAGYRVRVFEFVATEHTAKNLMLAAVRRPAPGARPGAAQAARQLAAFYGIRAQRLAARLGFALEGEDAP